MGGTVHAMTARGIVLLIELAFKGYSLVDETGSL